MARAGTPAPMSAAPAARPAWWHATGGGRRWAERFALAALYVVLALGALRLDPVAGFATLVWPPTGLALAALVRRGRGLWPGITAGAFLANLLTGASVPVALGIAFGNTLEAVIGATVLRRVASGEPSLDRLRDALGLVFGVAIAATAVSASVGVVSLWAGGVVSGAPAFGFAWLAWWMGDAAAALVMAPLLLMRGHELRAALARRSYLELTLLAVGIALAGFLVFGPGLPPTHDSRQGYLFFPVLVWAAARFRAPGAAFTAAALSALAITGTALGHGPFAHERLQQSLLDLQSFMLVVAATGLLLGASKAEVEASEARASFLARTSEVLAGSLDYQATLDQVSRLAVPFFADWCIVDVVEGEVVRRVAVSAADPAKRATLIELRDRYPLTPDSPQPAARALREGRPFLERRFTPRGLALTVRDERHHELLQQLAPRAAMALPLLGSGRTVGVITFALAESGRYYRPADLGLGEEIARRVALAIENARLHREREQVEAERTRLYESERAARAEAEEASRAKDEFLAMLGHELRNPLAPMVTALHLMGLRGHASAGSKELEVIARQVRHLVRLVDDLLDVSRITRGKIALDRRELEVSSAVAAAVEMAGPLFQQRRHVLEVEVPRTGLMVSADPDRLAQVLTNLLTNAAKYTPPEGHVRVSARREGDEVVIRVRDSGMGISPALLPNVFEPFVQGPRSAARSEGGLGIGLALVKSLVALHGGSVAASSEGLDRGSEFVVRLPVAAPVIAASDDRRSPSAAPAAGLAVLVVDDNRDAAELTAEMLRELGYVVSVAFDPATALDLVARSVPDVAIVDLGLPVMDGYELARQIRARTASGGRPPRFVALTGYGQETDRARSAAAGFFAHLVKPVDLATLTAALSPPTEVRTGS